MGEVVEKHVTVYVGAEGREFPTREEAEVSFRIEPLADWLSDAGGVYYDFSTRAAAEAMLTRRDEVLKLLGVEVPGNV